MDYQHEVTRWFERAYPGRGTPSIPLPLSMQGTASPSRNIEVYLPNLRLYPIRGKMLWGGTSLGTTNDRIPQGAAAGAYCSKHPKVS